MKMNVKKTASNGETDALRRNVKLEPPRTIPRSLLSKSSVEVNLFSRWFLVHQLRIVMIWEHSASSIPERFHGSYVVPHRTWLSYICVYGVCMSWRLLKTLLSCLCFFRLPGRCWRQYDLPCCGQYLGGTPLWWMLQETVLCWPKQRQQIYHHHCRSR